MSAGRDGTVAGPVGMYLHHGGSGHRHRGRELAHALVARGADVTGLGTGGAPAGWPGAWVELEPDDEPAPDLASDPTARGRLHWAPLGHDGFLARQARLSAWLAETRPGVLVVDVSQEVALLARLHGVPVVSVVLPGHRADPAHAVGLGVSSALVAFWPDGRTPRVTGLADDDAARLVPLGGLSRFAPAAVPVVRAVPSDSVDPRRVVVLAGSGGGWRTLAEAGRRLTAALPASRVDVLGPDRWEPDPWPLLTAADVVVCHAGQNALAEVAAARRPAVVVPLARPFDEQVTTGIALRRDGWPAEVVDDPATADWDGLVRAAARRDGAGWAGWVDGGAAERFADLVASLMPARAPAEVAG